ncbi:MAG: hypothetical protein Q8O52_15200 [Sulfuritalea sp.]|nr:hypothetical protein [Sulfuritalea sp.]
MLLIDSDILIDAARKDTQALAFITDAAAHHVIATSTITRMELLAGCRNPTEWANTESALDAFAHLPLTPDISEKALSANPLMIPTPLLNDGSVLVPESVREKLNIKDGDGVVWTEINGHIVLTTPQRQPVAKHIPAAAPRTPESGQRIIDLPHDEDLP